MVRELDHARQRRGVDVLQHDLGVAHNGGVDEVDEQLRRPLVAAAADDRDARAAMVRSSADTVRCRTHSARRPLTGQMDVGVVRCCPFTNRGDPWAIEEQLRRTTFTVCVVTLLLAALTFGATSRQSSGSDAQGVTKDSIKVGIPLVDFDAIKDFVDYDFGDTEAISKVFVDYINDNGGIDGRKIDAGVQEVPADPGRQARPAVALHRRSPRTTRSSRCSVCSSTSPARVRSA